MAAFGVRRLCEVIEVAPIIMRGSLAGRDETRGLPRTRSWPRISGFSKTLPSAAIAPTGHRASRPT